MKTALLLVVALAACGGTAKPCDDGKLWTDGACKACLLTLTCDACDPSKLCPDPNSQGACLGNVNQDPDTRASCVFLECLDTTQAQQRCGSGGS